MTDEQFEAFMALLMCSDHGPLDALKILYKFADEEAQKRGFDDWIHAYHEM
jgi:hypothetical protein